MKDIETFLAQARELLCHDNPVDDFNPVEVTRVREMLMDALFKYGPAADWAVYLHIEAWARHTLNPEREYGAESYFKDRDFTCLGIVPKLPSSASPEERRVRALLMKPDPTKEEAQSISEDQVKALANAAR